MISTRPLFLGTLAYAGVTFWMPYFWHLVPFAAYGLLIGLVYRRNDP